MTTTHRAAPARRIPRGCFWSGVGAMVVGVVLALIFGWLGSANAGWRGTHGTFTVANCSVSYDTIHRTSSKHHRSGRDGVDRDVTCGGSFTTDDGSSTDGRASYAGDKEYVPGARVAMNRTGDAGDYSYARAEAKVAGLWFMGAFLSLLFVAAGFFTMAVGRDGERVGPGTFTLNARGSSLLYATYAVLAVSLGGALCCVVLGYAL